MVRDGQVKCPLWGGYLAELRFADLAREMEGGAGYSREMVCALRRGPTTDGHTAAGETALTSSLLYQFVSVNQKQK